MSVTDKNLLPISDATKRYLRNRVNYLPWENKSKEDIEEFEELKQILLDKAGAVSFGYNCYISPLAHVYTEKFEIARRSWIAAGVILRGRIKIGANSTINSNTHIAGDVVIGDSVRIASMVSIYGFNHGYERTDIEIYKQPHTRKGVTICDDVWIGAGAVIVDGVTIGAHSIVAAGAIVTKSFGEYCIIGGNPARIIKSRLNPSTD